MSDPRSRASEEFAFRLLGFRILADEPYLMRKYAGHRVPEGVFVDDLQRIVTVEVKRIVGNALPKDCKTKERRKVLSSGRPIWPWNLTILSALQKANSPLVRDYGVRVHHIVILHPTSLTFRERRRLRERCCLVLTKYMDESCLAPYLSLLKGVTLHVSPAPDDLFDRF